jgi:CHASE2 domain-containing sensor protein/two-component sensor histidine kinase
MSFMQKQNGKQSSSSRFPLNDLASAAFILLFLSFTLHLSGLLSQVDDLIYDLGQRLNISAPPDDVIIVAIDQDSLSQLGRWPWSRDIHAQLLQRLKAEQPAAIGLDIIFAEPEQDNPQADQSLSKAIADASNVVLPVLLESVRENGQIIETLPMPLFMQSAADVGRVHAVLDADSIARAVYLYEGIGAPVWQLFSQAILNTIERQPSKNNFKLNHDDSLTNAYTLMQKDKRRISFSGPPGHFNHISYVQVLKGEFLPETFKNKVVLVGATALGMNDLLPTPVSGLSTPMTGVEFHANVFTSLRNNTLIRTVPLWLSSVIILIISLMPLLWMPKMTALKSFISTILFMILVTMVAGFLPKLTGIWVPPAASVLTLLLAYPIWGWRKLEAAQRYLDFELDYLKKNMADIHRDEDKSALRYDAFDARIAQVRNASKQLRYLNENRKETLAFISHDLRAPLASAIAVIEKHEEMKALLHKPLSQALGLAEDFLQASRAEVIDVNAFDEIDFVGLVHQAVDDAYNEATKKRINLIRDIADNVVWVEGNFGLLHRAILNLILNAIKYSPEKTEVVVKVSLVELSSIVVFVTDQGPGISNKDQINLFKRFSRVKGHEKTVSGTGLGLYFVKVVVEKHRGLIQVKSDIGTGTTFSISLHTVGVA